MLLPYQTVLRCPPPPKPLSKEQPGCAGARPPLLALSLAPSLPQTAPTVHQICGFLCLHLGKPLLPSWTQ